MLVGTGFFCYEVKLDKTIDDHARLTFTGIIPEEKEDQYVKMAGEQTDVELQYTDENGKNKMLFHGMLLKLLWFDQIYAVRDLMNE
ncbi:MAG: hypothetical protein E7L01_05045 [Paenibacillus macerans]|uniref:hypothetical protein n=1 Tax=Paenibacillus TaxID=44249 RepID=UPI000F58DFB8|nr:hypothetical protein [Paenibacillus macerans]MBS5909206.1 hypothetical protein [Paenibacillus macerans]MDU7472717.1 hypothetical protein [Paenibacillus macerans]MEC0139087.1 hypothetical protein [Paenibacillus macerans]